jgi:hypothetical protein
MSENRLESRTYPAPPLLLLEEWVERTPLSWRQIAAIVSLGLIALLLVAAYLDGILAEAPDISFWRNSAMFPGIIGYTLFLQDASRRLRDGAIKALRPLVPVDDDEFYRLLAQRPLFNRRRQWLALGIGASVMLLSTPWGALSWMKLYQLVGGALMLGLLSWIVYTTLTATRLGAGWEISEDINVFELQRLHPIARWSLGNALSYIGGITLSLLFIGRFTLNIGEVITYAVLTIAAVVVFFSSMTSTHRMMVEAKNRELEIVRQNLVAASQALKQRAAQDQVEDMHTQFNLIAAWGDYEKRVEQLADWPYTGEIRRNLFVSLLLPFAVYIIPSVLPGLVEWFLSM